MGLRISLLVRNISRWTRMCFSLYGYPSAGFKCEVQEAHRWLAFWIRHRNISAFLITFLSEQHNFVRVNDWLIPLLPWFHLPTALFFWMQHLNYVPPTSYTTNIIAGVEAEVLIGVRCSSCHPTTMANNQRYRSLSIIFSALQQQRSLSMEYGMSLL